MFQSKENLYANVLNVLKYLKRNMSYIYKQDIEDIIRCLEPNKKNEIKKVHFPQIYFNLINTVMHLNHTKQTSYSVSSILKLS